MNRRELIKSSMVVGGVALIGGSTLTQIACSPPKLNTWVQTIVGAIGELKPLLPAQAALLGKIAKVASDFNSAYQAGKFRDAITIFENLSTLIDQLIADVGVSPSQQVKIILAVTGVALRTIAVILRDQANNSTVAGIVAGNDSSAVKLVDRLSEPREVDSLFKAIKQ